MSSWYRILSALIATTASLSLAGCGRSEADPRTAPQLVRVTTPIPAAGAEREFTGVVSARVQSDLGFRVGGKITARLVDAGQKVRRGQPLMRIDSTDLALAAATQDGAVTAARARAVQTSADEARYRELVGAGAVSASAYDQIKAAAQSARAQLVAAEAQARVARNETGYSTLLADADGVVVETLAEPGQVVSAGQIVVRLAQAGPREATISLPETVRPAIGSAARANIYGVPAWGAARLRQLSDAADPKSRTFDARYSLEGPPAAAPLGATVRIALPLAGKASGMQIPLAALYDSGHGPGVWVLTGGEPKVAWRRVTIAGLSDETATISSGLAPGERIVALGAHLLHEGERVRVDAVATASL
ncbi:efflux RND transporter periplasmic adaptor subunit [Sphingomonas oligophenolica]|uniref:Efflux RND transporter periplasmic adaptor subunit n=2 Tax=Sphingomonas oligophenolica TaxID=301154 RepID=A0ABU9Y5H3_9SPHN